jgi:hypothetical protein
MTEINLRQGNLLKKKRFSSHIWRLEVQTACYQLWTNNMLSQGGGITAVEMQVGVRDQVARQNARAQPFITHSQEN